MLSGTPTAGGTYTFAVTATDSVGASGSQSYTLTVLPLSLSSTLPDWTVTQTPYNGTITAANGTAPYTFTLTSGTLPPGVTLASRGVLSGTPTAVGTYAFLVTATDALGNMGFQNYKVTINPGVAITTTILAAWTVNVPGYNQTFTAAGGTGSDTFATTSGNLPSGLTISPGGVLSGTPTASGSFTFTVTATDQTGATASQSYTLTINPVVSFATTTLAAWTVSQPGYGPSQKNCNILALTRS